MKNYTTPRTLADCEFVVGYPIADMTPRRNDWTIAIVCVCICLGIIWIAK